MISFLLKLVPNQYKWSVAIKKASYTVAKLAVAGIVTLGVGKDIDLSGFEAGLAAVIAGSLEIGHDWARLKWPNAKWL